MRKKSKEMTVVKSKHEFNDGDGESSPLKAQHLHPTSEDWLRKKPKAMESVLKGIEEATLNGALEAPESFSKYVSNK